MSSRAFRNEIHFCYFVNQSINQLIMPITKAAERIAIVIGEPQTARFALDVFILMTPETAKIIKIMTAPIFMPIIRIAPFRENELQ
jgi:hypothetical protein